MTGKIDLKWVPPTSLGLFMSIYTNTWNCVPPRKCWHIIEKLKNPENIWQTSLLPWYKCIDFILQWNPVVAWKPNPTQAETIYIYKIASEIDIISLGNISDCVWTPFTWISRGRSQRCQMAFLDELTEAVRQWLRLLSSTVYTWLWKTVFS